jgi:hypothetical protein
MTIDELEATVLQFLQAQPDYSQAALRVGHKNLGNWYILYGNDEDNSIVGFGASPIKAWRDFLAHWELYGGEEWLIRIAN